MRKHYLDNIRWITVCLVLIYHVFYIFNGVGVPGGISYAKNIPFFDGAASLVYPWFMVLLFVVSGMSAKMSLEKRKNKDFIKERARKLLVPSILGPFVIHFITGYLNIKIGGGLEYIPGALVYPISVISGTGPLWFIQLLFVFSVLLVLIRKLEKGKFSRFCEKTNVLTVFLLFIPIFLSAQILNMPVITTYRFGIYFTSFLIGYFVFSHDNISEKICKARYYSLGLAVVSGIIYAFLFAGTNYTLDICLKHIITNIYAWFTVLCVLGFGKKYLNKERKYLSASSFGIYILHYPVLMCVCYILVTYFNLPAILNYLIALVLGFVLTFLLYEVIKRIPVLRYIVLGIKKK